MKARAKKLATAALKAAVWARSPEGRRDIGAGVAALTAIYTALHRAGV